MVNNDRTPNQTTPLAQNEDFELRKYVDHCERMIHESLSNGEDFYKQKLFIAFQNTATNVTRIFRERPADINNWNTFHDVAESVTMFYKESLQVLKDAIQLGVMNGEMCKTKEFLTWTDHQQRSQICIDDIYHYVTDRSINPSFLRMENNDAVDRYPLMDDFERFRGTLTEYDNEHRHSTTVDFDTHSEQRENFKRKRDCSLTDLSTNDFEKFKHFRRI